MWKGGLCKRVVCGRVKGVSERVVCGRVVEGWCV